jgi:hypothetical protein
VQQIAHTVLAPLGVPNSQPEPRDSGPAAIRSTAAAVNAGGQSSASGGAGGASCPCPATSATKPAGQAVAYTVTLTATKARVKAGGSDLFTGKVNKHGAAAKGVHVRLLEHVAGVSGWKVVATGVTGRFGRVGLRINLPASATFKLALAGGKLSAPVSVTVTAPVTLRLTAGQPTDRLIVTAPSGTPGQIVWLAVLDNGTWKNLKSKPLGSALHAVFTLPASTAEGHFYRAEIAASGAQSAALSNSLLVPRHPHTGAKSIGGPTASPNPTASPTTSASASSSPMPTASPTPTGSGSSAPLSSSPVSTQSPSASAATPAPSGSPVSPTAAPTTTPTGP